MSSTTPVISMRTLRKEYRYHRQQPGLGGALKGLFHRVNETRVAVDTLDLTINPGEFVGLLGRNGAGKTTTLKMCSGLLRPTSGDITVLGHVPYMRRPSKRSFDFLRRIAVVLGQKSMLWWDVSTLDSLRLHQAIYDLPKQRFERSVARLAELLGLDYLLNIPVRKLSLGERMKCELLVALVHEPEVIFLDEPTIGLDVVSKAAIREFLATLNSEQGTTIVLTSHDMDDVSELCERIILIDHGRLQFDGPLTELIRDTRPHKQVTLLYAAPPRLPDDLPGVRVRDVDHGRLECEVDRDSVQQLLSLAPSWGDIVDLEVRDADLDEVMRAVLAGDRR